MKSVSFVFLLGVAACSQSKFVLTEQGEAVRNNPPVAKGVHAAVAAPNPEISAVAIQILKQGGNAVDAAIAASFAMAVVRPQSCGIGGGGFMLIYDKNKKATRALDFRERAPLAATAKLYQDQSKKQADLMTKGAWSVATPGFVAGMWQAYQEQGRGRILWKD